MRSKSPILWMGSKTYMLNNLRTLLPGEWNTYIEPYFGSGTLFFALPPANIEVINDVDSALMDLYRVLRDPDLFNEFHRLADLTLFSRELFNECVATWRYEKDIVKRAWKWWVVARQSFGGKFGEAWGYWASSNSSSPGSILLSAVKKLPEIHMRLRNAQIENDDALKVIKRYARDDSLIYCDPPYIMDTRLGGEYRHEVDDDHHRQLVELLLECPSKVMLSGYKHEIYLPLEDAGWRRFDFEICCQLVGRTQKSGLLGEGAIRANHTRTESVWTNYDPPRIQNVDLFTWASKEDNRDG